MLGSVGMGVFLLVAGWCFSRPVTPSVLLLAAILGYCASFSLSLGPVVWVVMSEIFPTRIRGRAMAIATFCLWCACFAVSQTVPILFETLGRSGTFYGYALMCAVMLALVWRVLPETKGKTLEDIERSWLHANG